MNCTGVGKGRERPCVAWRSTPGHTSTMKASSPITPSLTYHLTSLAAEKKQCVVVFCPLLQQDISRGYLRSQPGFWAQPANGGAWPQAELCRVARAGQAPIPGQRQQRTRVAPHLLYVAPRTRTQAKVSALVSERGRRGNTVQGHA